MSRDLIKQLKSLKNGEVNPRAEWLKSNRELLLSQIKNTIAPEEVNKKGTDNAWNTLSIFFPKNFVFNVMRPATVLLVILSVVTSGWISTVDAAYEALPGDLLYPAKRATEKTRVTVAAVMGDKKTEAKLHVEFAKRRAQETKKIIASSDPNKNEKMTQAVSSLKDEIKSAANKLEEIKKDTSVQLTVDVVKEVSQNTEQIKVALQDVKETLATNASSTENSQLTKDVTEAKDLTKEAAIKTVEVVVTKHLEGDTSITQDDVKQVVDNALESATKEIAQTNENTSEVNQVVQEAKTEVKDLSKDLAVNQDPAMASTTKDLVQKIDAVSTETKEATVKTQEITTATDKIVAEAKESLISGDLTKALETVKTVTETAKEVEKISDQTLQTVQNVLPLMSVVRESGTVSTSTASVVAPTALTAPTTPIAPTVPTTSIPTTTLKN